MINQAKLFDEELVRQTIRLLFEEGDVYEVRALQAVGTYSKKPHTIQGFFNSADRILDALPLIGRAQGIYVTLNPVNPALLSRADNRLEEWGGDGFGTSDKDIPRRRWVLIDCDPHRPKHISSTEEELGASVSKARDIYKHLQGFGFGSPISACSGNGIHLLYRIDLPADDQELLKRVLAALHDRLSDDRVTIDTAVYNPSRITKLYGTLVCKGDDTHDRPHRLSRIRKSPEDITIVTREMLEAVACSVVDGVSDNKTKENILSLVPVVCGGGRFNLKDFIAKHGIAIHGVKQQGDKTIHMLDACPWGTGHGSGDKPNDSCIIEFQNGAVEFKCFHAACSSRKWRDFRSLYEPGYDLRRGDGGGTIIVPEFISATELNKTEFAEKKWIVPDLIPHGLTIVSGKPKTGKSWAMMDLALQVALGGKVFGCIDVQAGETLYLALEDGKRRLQERLQRLLDGQEPPARLHFIGAETGWKTLDKGGLEMLTQSLVAYPATRLIVIDTLQRVKPAGRQGSNAYENDYAGISRLQELAINRDIGIVVVHHLRKSEALSGDVFDEVSGSLGLTAVADTNIIIKRNRISEDATLTMTSRDATEKEFAMRFNEQTCKWIITGEAAEVHRSRERDEILAILREFGGEMDAQEIMGALEEQGVRKKDSTIRWHLRRMAKDGDILNPTRGKYCISWRHSERGVDTVRAADDGVNTDQQTNIQGHKPGLARGGPHAPPQQTNIYMSPSGTETANMFVCWSPFLPVPTDSASDDDVCSLIDSKPTNQQTNNANKQTFTIDQQANKPTPPTPLLSTESELCTTTTTTEDWLGTYSPELPRDALRVSSAVDLPGDSDGGRE